MDLITLRVPDNSSSKTLKIALVQLPWVANRTNLSHPVHSLHQLISEGMITRYSIRWINKEALTSSNRIKELISCARVMEAVLRLQFPLQASIKLKQISKHWHTETSPEGRSCHQANFATSYMREGKVGAVLQLCLRNPRIPLLPLKNSLGICVLRRTSCLPYHRPLLLSILTKYKNLAWTSFSRTSHYQIIIPLRGLWQEMASSTSLQVEKANTQSQAEICTLVPTSLLL